MYTNYFLLQIFTKQEFVYKEEVFGSDDDNESQTIYPLPDVTNESSESTSLAV